MGSQSAIPTSPFSAIYPVGLFLLVEFPLLINLLEQTYSVLSHFLSNPVYQVSVLMETMLAAVTMPTSVWGSKVISLADKFQSTTATPDPPGINLEVMTGTNIFLHLGDGSTSTWT